MKVNPYDKIKATIGLASLAFANAVALIVAFSMFFIGIPDYKSRIKLCHDKMESLRNAPESQDNSYDIKSLQSDIDFYETQIGKYYSTSFIVFIIGTLLTIGSIKGYKTVIPLWRGQT